MPDHIMASYQGPHPWRRKIRITLRYFFPYLLALLLFNSLAASAQDGIEETVPPAKAWGLFLQRWEDLRTSLEERNTASAERAAEDLLEAKWDGALGDLGEPAIALLRWASRLHKEGDPEAAAWMAETAEKLAPGSVEVRLALARYYLGGGPSDPEAAISHYLLLPDLYATDFNAGMRGIGRVFASLVLFIGFLGAVLALANAVRYGTLLAHDLGDFFPPGLISQWIVRAVTLAILVLPLAAGLSFWWLAAWWLIVFSLYMKGAERAMVLIWVVFLAVTPIMISKYGLFMASRSESVLQSAIDVRNGVPDAEDRSVLEDALEKDPEDLLARVALAEIYKRNGQLNRAVITYRPALKDPVTSQMAYNNVAEIYYVAGDLESVSRALSAAMDAGPERVELLYNLSQYYNQSGELLKVEEQFERARNIDEKKLSLIREKEGPRRINRALAAMPIPAELYWERVMRGSPAAVAVYPGLWTKWMGNISGTGFYGAGVLVFVSVIVLMLGSRKWKLSYRCKSCGKPVCPKCHRMAKDPSICMPCYSVFMGDGSVELKTKMEKRSEVQRFRDWWSRGGMAASILVPGSGQFLMGGTLIGIVLLVLSGALISSKLSGKVVWPPDSPAYSEGLALHGIIPILIYLIVVIVSVAIFRSRSDRWR